MKGWLAMKIRNLDEITATAGVEKNKIKNKSEETSELEFVPSKETLNACAEIQDMISGNIPKNIYHSFDEMWSDICGS